MAQFPFALLRIFCTTGTIPYLGMSVSVVLGLLHELGEWKCYLVSFAVQFILQLSGSMISPFLPYLALFQLDFDRGPTRQVQRLQHLHGTFAFDAYDVRYMILTCYCLHQHFAAFFSALNKWYCSWFDAIKDFEILLELPSCWMYRHSTLLWPPDGPILHLVLLTFLILSHFYVFARCFLQGIKDTLTRKMFCFWSITLGCTWNSFFIWLGFFQRVLQEPHPVLPIKLPFAVLATIYALSSNDFAASANV